MFLALAFLVAVIVYRLVLVFLIRWANVHHWKFASMLPSMTAACIKFTSEEFTPSSLQELEPNIMNM